MGRDDILLTLLLVLMVISLLMMNEWFREAMSGIPEWIGIIHK